MITVTLCRFVYNELVQPFIDTLFPPVCALCGEPMSPDRDIVCAACIEKLTPARERITLPIDERAFDNIFILCEYDTQIRSLIHLLKYNRFTKVTRHLAEYAQKEKCIKNIYDFIIPVPLHPVKLRERGYNQSAELARYLSIQMQLPYSEEILKRNRYTISQTKLSRECRSKNVQNAFICCIPLNNKSLLLVDDVVTTGSTANACACALKSAGAVRVDIFALANPSLRESRIIM